MQTYVPLTLIVFAVSSIATYALIPSLIRLAFKKGFTVTPRHRRIQIPPVIRRASHNYTIPLTGGLAIFLPFVVSMLLVLLLFPDLFAGPWHLTRFLALLISGSAVAATGLADDIYKLSHRARFWVTIPLMGIMLWFTALNQVFYLPGDYLHHIGYVELVVLLIWCLGLSNAINLIDGLDGAAAGIVAIAALWLGLITTADAFLVTIVLTTVTASCIAFLAFNFHPARIFLGSTGTLFMGFVLAVLTIWPPTREMDNYFFPYAVLIFALPLTDMAVVFLIRLWHGRNPFTADSWHIHDRVLLTGASRKQACLIIWGVSFVCGLVAYLSFRGLIPYLVAVALTLGVLGVFYAVVNRKIKPANVIVEEQG